MTQIALPLPPPMLRRQCDGCPALIAERGSGGAGPFLCGVCRAEAGERRGSMPGTRSEWAEFSKPTRREAQYG